MPKIWLTWNPRWNEYDMWEAKPGGMAEAIECEMNASLFRQIRAAEAKYEKFQEILEKFYAEGVAHPDTVRRVR